MSVNVRDKIEKLNAVERRKVEDRAAELIAEEMSLRDLRKARKLTQPRVAKVLGVTQDSVSRLEKTQRPIAFHTTKNGQSDGWRCAHHCGIS
jgi:DNA-binding XRE family transcriptional regulator